MLKQQFVPILAVMFVLHQLALNLLPRAYFPELVFPAWIISQAKFFISEDQTMHPPLLYYLVSWLTGLTGNTGTSIDYIRTAVVLLTDLLLVYILYPFKRLAVLTGLAFYILWQSFFRGNALWFDMATVPFLALSFINFKNYLNRRNNTDMLLSGISLGLGYLFKQTIFWVSAIYILYLVWEFFLQRQNFRKTVYLIFLFSVPQAFSALSGFTYTAFVSKSWQFALNWSLMMPLVVFSRLPTSGMGINSGFIPIIIILLGFYGWSLAVLRKHLDRASLLLFSLTLISMGNIYPRWGDFHLQPAVFFFSILFGRAFSFWNYKGRSLFLGFLLMTLFIPSLYAFIHRLQAYRIPRPTSVLAKYAPESYNGIIRGRKIFAYDSPLYHKPPQVPDTDYTSFGLAKLLFFHPEDYYRQITPMASADLITKFKPDSIIITENTFRRLSDKGNITDIERLILLNYRLTKQINSDFYLFSQ